MTGWAKALTIIALVVIGTVALNIAAWRRMKEALAGRRAWTEEDCRARMATDGHDPRVIAVVLDLIRPCYNVGVAPHPDDHLRRFLDADEDRVAGWVAQGAARLGIGADGGRMPVLATVDDLAAHLGRRVRGPRPGPG